MLRLMLGFLGSGLLLLAPGPLGAVVAEGMRLSGVALVWLILAGVPGGKPPPVPLVLAMAVPSLVAAGRLDPAIPWVQKAPLGLLAVLLIGVLAHGALGATHHSQPGRKRRYELAWWSCLILPQALATCWAFGGLHGAPVWLQAWIQLGPFEGFCRGEFPSELRQAPVLTLLPWLLVVWPVGERT